MKTGIEREKKMEKLVLATRLLIIAIERTTPDGDTGKS